MTAPAAQAEPTYLARLTPPGSGAIAALALYGPDAWRLLDELFQPREKNSFHAAARSAFAPGKFWLGKLGDPAQQVGDDVVVALKQVAPQPWLEIQCHGGQQVIALLEELFSARGVQLCSWRELWRHAGKSLLEVAALHALGETTTLRTAAIVLDQQHGAFAAVVQHVLDALHAGQTEEAARQLEDLVRWTALGRHLTAPWRVAVAGAPNVGKSSLMNRLAGYQRCVVSPIPGTTRDLVSTRIAVDGWPVELIDTAGIREQAGTLETQGIELALAAAAEADLCLWLLDASAPPVLPPRSLPLLRLVINKSDLPAAWNLAEYPDALHISAATGGGFDDLLQTLSRWLVPAVPPPGAAVPFSSDLCQTIAAALQGLQQGELQHTVQTLYNCLGSSAGAR